jgi:hypothetical protein
VTAFRPADLRPSGLKIRFPRAYDLFASALTVHLDAAGKAALFRRVCDRLRALAGASSSLCSPSGW